MEEARQRASRYFCCGSAILCTIFVAMAVSGPACTPSGNAPPDGGGDQVVDGVDDGNGAGDGAADDCVAQAENDTDSDADGRIDLCDNCPATANSEQADADGDGLGDECDGGTASGFALRTSDGIMEYAFDGRVRPSLLVADGRRAEFNWSDDATQVDITIHDDLGSLTVNLSVDLSDEALSALLDELAAETGVDPTALREGLAENPGLVARVAAGLEPPPETAKRRDAATSQAKTGPNLQADDQGEVERAMKSYLTDLFYKGIMLMFANRDMYDAYRQYLDHFGQMESEEETRARGLMVAGSRLEREAHKTHDSQREACIPCTSDCVLGCDTLGLGACCTFQGPISSCLDDIQEEACQEIDGSDYHPGSFCAALECGVTGACCTSIDCVNTNEARCIDRYGGKFTPDVDCAEVNCRNGACYTFYPSNQCPAGFCCCDCHPDFTDESCQQLPDFAYFARAETCPGACYHGSGGYGTYCLSETESECVNDGGLFFHESLCIGVCFFDEDGCEVITERECAERDGHIESNGFDSCAGACYLGGGLCVETVTRGDCVGGSFYLGELCP